MDNNPPSDLERSLNLDFRKDNNEIWLTSQYTLRKLIGILGVCLPLLLFVVLLLDSGFTHPLNSISHYYYTRANPVFIIVVSLLAIFLLVYKGKEPVDLVLSSLAGVAALLLLLFPTSNISDYCNDPAYPESLMVLPVNPGRVLFHYISSGVFLGSLAWMSAFIFTKSDKPPAARSVKKKTRNRVFRICAVVMLMALLVIIANFAGLLSDEFFDRYNLTFWMETIALEAFGISWLVKGELILEG
ncbi:MAG: hypothetical protein EOO05_13330 [Chitinophagaceae bacterium]|nr:MAG: hypothetical protein EOO05_13330 [Chitinophagaceae bacterium]